MMFGSRQFQPKQFQIKQFVSLSPKELIGFLIANIKLYPALVGDIYTKAALDSCSALYPAMSADAATGAAIDANAIIAPSFNAIFKIDGGK